MMKIEFSLAVALYLTVTVCVILILWAIFEKKKIQAVISSEDRFFWQCGICTFVYVDSMHEVISKCPRCGSYNKKEESESSK